MDTSPSRLDVGLLGPPRVLVDGAPVEVDTRKAIALLAYLCERETPAPREELAWLLWPESTSERARGALRRTISSLRRALGGRWVEADRDHVRFDTNGATIDTVALTQDGTVDGVRGRFLDGFVLRDAPDFDDWQASTAQHYDRLIRSGFEQRARDALAAGDAAMAVTAAERRLSFDPLDESSHRLLMTALARSGDRAAAIRQFRTCVGILEDELAVDPLDETVTLYERILAGDLEPPADPGPAPIVVDARPKVSDPGLTAAADALRRRAARPGVVRIGGPPGSGRSTIAAEALPDAVTAVAYPSDRTLPHALSRTILRALAERSPVELDERAAPAAHVEPSLARRVDELPDLGGDFGFGRLVDGVTEAIGQLLGDAVLVVDDVDEADAESKLALERLADRAVDLDITVVLVGRPTGSDVSMAPLQLPTVEALVDDGDVAQRIVDATGGWVGPTIDVALAGDVEASITELRERRMSELDPIARQALEALVVIGSGRLADVAATAGRPADDVASAIDRLAAVGLVKAGERHEPNGSWVSDSIMRDLGTARTALLHGRAADALEGQPDASPARAIHLERAGRRAEAATAHAEAAGAAASLFGYEAARRHVESAIALGHPDPRSLYLLAGESATRAGAYDAAITAYTAAAAHGTDWQLEQTIGDVYLRWGRWDLARATFLASLDLADSPDARASVLADLAVVASRSGNDDEARTRTEAALADMTEDSDTAARVLNVAGLVLGDAAHLQAAITRARRSGRREDEAAALNNLALAYGRSGRTAEAISMAERALGLLDRTGDRHRRAAVLGNLADLHHDAGDDERSNTLLRQAVALFAEVGVGAWEPEIWKLTGW